jgi:hypothetical protein
MDEKQKIQLRSGLPFGAFFGKNIPVDTAIARDIKKFIKVQVQSISLQISSW